MKPKKVALWFLIVSVAISAALGIIAVLSGSFGDFQIRIILTTLTISAASICALACGALWEGRGRRVLPSVGIVLALTAAALLIAAIWFEPQSGPFWKFTASTGVLAVATAHDSLLSLAKLARRFYWGRIVSLVAVYALAALIVLCIYIQPTGDLGFRLIGATSIVVAAVTIIIPIFHRLSRDDFSVTHADKHDPAGPALWATITCPQCGASQPNSLTEITCERCGCRFVTKILDRGRDSRSSTRQ